MKESWFWNVWGNNRLLSRYIYVELHLYPALLFDINHLYLGIKGYHWKSAISWYTLAISQCETSHNIHVLGKKICDDVYMKGSQSMPLCS